MVGVNQCLFERDGERVRCIRCGVSVKTARPPHQVHSRCAAPGVLTWQGRLLVRLAPGDGLAWIARHTGLRTMAALWEQASGRSCHCGDRQQWLNDRWRSFVWRHFAVPDNSVSRETG